MQELKGRHRETLVVNVNSQHFVKALIMCGKTQNCKVTIIGKKMGMSFPYRPEEPWSRYKRKSLNCQIRTR